MDALVYLWDGGPFVLSSVAAILLGIGCIVRSIHPTRRWFAFGVFGNLFWAIAFACRAMTNLNPSYFTRERMELYINFSFLVGGILLCVFGINHISNHVVISKPTAQNENGATDQDAR